MSSPRTFRFITLGCKVNQYDTQVMREAARAAGLRPAARGEPADLVVVNTCTVTAASDEKCRQAIRKAVRENPGARVVVAGCYVNRDRAALEAIEGVADALSNEEKPRLAAIAAEVAGAPAPAGRPRGVSGFEGHSRAFVKIQDGCDAFCSYCIVPHVRGRPRSRPLADVVAEVQRLTDAGFREMVFTGIHLGAYGKDLADAASLADVVREVVRSTDAPRFRLSSIEAMEVDDALLQALADAGPRACPHLHLPLQSGDDDVLRRMNRRYTAAEFLERTRRVRAALDDPAITSDVMVGFPGETEEAFRRTIETCREAGFSRLHIFPFSPRAGTPAAAFPDRPAPAVVAERKARLAEAARALQAAFERRREGAVETALVEHRRDRATGRLRGYTERYVLAVFEGPDDAMGRLAPVRLERSAGGFMEAALLPPD